MADTVSVGFSGLRELGEAMRGLANEVNTKIARSATLAGALVIKNETIRRAPVDTCNLRKNIITKRVTKTPLTSQFLVAVRQGKKTKKQIAQGIGDAFYAKFVEYGTVNAPAKPFIRPAFEGGKEEAVNAIKDRLAAGIAKATK
jgi:HK97 gp10 family phage protein